MALPPNLAPSEAGPDTLCLTDAHIVCWTGLFLCFSLGAFPCVALSPYSVFFASFCSCRQSSCGSFKKCEVEHLQPAKNTLDNSLNPGYSCLLLCIFLQLWLTFIPFQPSWHWTQSLFTLCSIHSRYVLLSIQWRQFVWRICEAPFCLTIL